MTFSSRVLGGVFVSLLFLGSMSAQLDRGTITGAIRDPQGAVVVGARVTAINVATNVSVSTTTTQSGDFTIPALLVGEYKVQIEAAGFKSETRNDVTLSAASVVRLDVSLEVGTASERVEVNSTVSPLATDSSSVSTTLGNKLVNDVPLEVSGQMRNVLNLTTLTPDIKVGTSGLYKAAGGQDGGWDMQMDGMSITPTSDSKSAARVIVTAAPVDAINEFTIESSTGMKAEYGQSMGMINFATKSGTDQFHGDAFDFFRNSAMDAKGYFATSNPRLQQNDFGATVGGPVILPKLYNGRNKTFFFLAYEGYSQHQGAQPTFFTIPTPAELQGDFSGYVNSAGQMIPIYDPATTRPNPNGSGYVRTPFPNNQIPVSRFSPLAVNYWNLRPSSFVPNVPGAAVANNFVTQEGSVLQPFDKGTARIDETLGATDTISGFFMRAETATEAGPNGGPGLPAPYTSLTIQDIKSTYGSLTWTHTLDPHDVSELRFNNLKGYGFVNAQSCAFPNVLWGAKIGVQNVPGPDQCVPAVTFTNTYSSMATIPGGRGRDDSWIWSLSENFTMVRGPHTFMTGFSFAKNNWAGGGSEAPNGVYGFAQLATAVPGDQSAASGNQVASFLLGYPNTVQVSTPRREVFVLKNLGTFLQDDWRLNSKLTLNLGLRYDYSFPIVGGGIAPGVQPGFSNFSKTTPNPGAPGRLGAIVYTGTAPGRTGSASAFPTWRWQFQPRVGLAYSIRNGTVIHISGGRSFEPLRVQGGTQSYDGFITDTTFTSSDLDINNFPAGTSLAAPPWVHPPSLVPTVDNGTGIKWWGPDAGTPPQYWTANFDIQQTLTASTVLTARYNYIRGEHLTSGLLSDNQISPSYLTTLGPALLTSPISSAAARAAGIPVPYAGFNGTVQQALSPYPQYQSIGRYEEHSGDSTYHAMIIKVEKRSTNGLTMLGSYTLSKMFTDADSYASGSLAIDTFNLKLQKALSADDQTHLIRYSIAYDLPFGKGRAFVNQGLLSSIIGNWTIAESAEYSSGYPLGVTTGTTLPIGGGPNRPFITSYNNWRAPYSGKFKPLSELWWNKSAFDQVPASVVASAMGNATVYNPKTRLPWNLNENVSLARTVPIKESLRLVLRFEGYNLLNRTVWAAPSSNALNAANFGQVRAQSNTPRQLQLVAKFYF
jgi:hypothetical protein